MSPDWFLGYDVIFELFFFIISLAIALYALKVYRNTNQKLAQYFGYGFLLVAAAYIAQSISNYLVYSKLNTQICVVANLSSTSIVDAIGTYAYMLLMIAGLVVLLFVSLKSDIMDNIISIHHSDNAKQKSYVYILSIVFNISCVHSIAFCGKLSKE
jgi:hypothetical protein